MESGEGLAEAHVNQALAHKMPKLCKTAKIKVTDDLCNPGLRNEGLTNRWFKERKLKGASSLFLLFLKTTLESGQGDNENSCLKQKEVVYITVPLIPRVKCELNRYRCFKKYLFLLLKPDWVLMFETPPPLQIICIILYFLQPPVHPYRNG